MDNIINGITDGPQGNELYRINTALVDLKNPMMTDEGKQQLQDLLMPN